jgi:ribosomal protein S18 acetylase RimI-like enzyme
MTAADVEPAVASILADDWGDRRSWFEFALANPACQAFVAEDREGRVVGTGVLTVHGSVGWIGTIWVARSNRRRGIGLALTEATLEAADDAACTTLVLVATDSGRPLYERLGFEVQTWYRTMEAPGGIGHRDGPDADLDDAATRIRSFRAGDLPAVIDLDRAATGEDRSASLGLLASPDGSRVLERDGVIVGFLIRAPWGGGATVAPLVGDALELIEARRRMTAPDRRMRCGILIENEAGAEALEARGWVEAWRAPRLIRGAALDWRPEQIWGQFNHAMG